MHAKVSVDARARQAHKDAEIDTGPTRVLHWAIRTNSVGWLLRNLLDDLEVLFLLGRCQPGVDRGVDATRLIVRPHPLTFESRRQRRRATKIHTDVVVVMLARCILRPYMVSTGVFAVIRCYSSSRLSACVVGAVCVRS